MTKTDKRIPITVYFTAEQLKRLEERCVAEAERTGLTASRTAVVRSIVMRALEKTR
jgi:hypothetical protein